MTPKRNQVTTTLLQFYDKPVAKVSLELFFTVITVIVFALFAIRPTLLTMSNLIKELDDKRKLHAKLEEKVAALSSAQVNYSIVQDQIEILDNSIPSTPKFEEAVLIIEKVASENQVIISSMNAKEIPKEPTAVVDFKQKTRVTRPISVNVIGEYPVLRKFIEDLRQVQRTLIIDSVIFNTFEQRGDKKLRATITVSVPYFGVDTQKIEAPKAPTDDVVPTK